MKEADFENIAKRLYDLEADPPSNGWNKIAPAIHTPTSTLNASWISRKNWWKPLLIVPAFIGTIITYNLNTNTRQSELVAIQTPETKAPRQSKVRMDSDKNISDHKASPLTAKHQSSKSQQKESFKSEQHISRNSQSEYIERNQIVERNTDPSTTFLTKTIARSTYSQGTNLLEESNHETKDSAIVMVDTLNIEESDSGLFIEDEPIEKVRKAWRITASIKSQYLTEPSRPVGNDEILVTNIKNQKQFKQIGYGFTVGAGKEITKHFYVDAQFSIIKTERTTQFSFSNGEVDTLIAVQKPDQSVVIKPVYKIRNSEIINQFTYRGMHLSGSYYFWQKQHRRFSLTASAGTHYLLQSIEKERVNGEWSTQKYINGNRINYSLMIGAGYSAHFKNGWEVTLSPAMMYYLKSPQRKDLPYNINLRSADLNIAVSKTIRAKK